MADANWASVVGALRLDNSLTDVGPKSQVRTWTATNGGHSSTQSKTGGYSFKSTFSGGVNYFRSDTHADFAVSDRSPVSAQSWFYIDSATIGATHETTFFKFTDGSAYIWLFNINRSLRVASSTAGTVDTGATIFNYDAWNHLLWVINGGTHKIYINGSLAATLTKTFSLTGTAYVQVGELLVGTADVYFDDVVIYAGAEAQTGTFTPVAPFQVGLTTAVASAVDPTTTFGTPTNTLTQPASGFLATSFGTPTGYNIQVATGFTSGTAFGTPLAVPGAVTVTASGFLPTTFGAAAASQHWDVHFPIGLVIRFGTPAVQPAQLKVTSMGRVVRIGMPKLRQFKAQTMAPRTRFGTPSARHTATGAAATCTARGRLRTVMGTPVGLYYTAP